MQYEKNKHKGIHAQWNGPSMTKPNLENGKNCSSTRDYECAQLTEVVHSHKHTLMSSSDHNTQYNIEQFW